MKKSIILFEGCAGSHDANTYMCLFIDRVGDVVLEQIISGEKTYNVYGSKSSAEILNLVNELTDLCK